MRRLWLACAMLTGCARVQNMMNPMPQWVGKNESDLVASWGAPDLTAQLPDGRHVLTWIKPKDQTTADVTAPGGIRHSAGECRMSFTVGADSKITRWAQSGC